MDIQEVFYYVATITMILAMLFLLGMVILLFYIKNKIKELDSYGKHVIGKADNVVEVVKNQVKLLTNLRATLLGKSSK